MDDIFDAVIVGGGPAGLSAALALGRARKRVLLCDAGPARNAAATHMHNFLSRDGTPPAELRRIGREQLAPYRTVSVRDTRIAAITGERGAFTVSTDTGAVTARRIVLCTGMIDEMLPLPGFADFWGTSIFQCPYCHAWEVQDRPFGVLAGDPHMLDFAILLRCWTDDVTVFTNAGIPVPPEAAARLASAKIRVEERRITRLTGTGGQLEAVELEGETVRRDVLFARPAQRQVPLVAALGLELEPPGFVRIDPMTAETSRPGIYAGGDLTTMRQGAIMAAGAGAVAAAMLNHALTVEQLTRG